MPAITRRAALAALFAAAPVAALAKRRRTPQAAPAGRILVDVSPLRANGDNIDADFLADALPGYLAKQFGPGHDVRVRIFDVSFGVAGSNGQVTGNGAVDSIEGVGLVDGREIPLFATVQTTVYFPDIGGYWAHERQDQLAQSFAQWLARKAGV
ncbi:MAG: hypothetical protein KGM15_03715 [Pseudomonadota bacterium]|nr:hypothetical protein [Pseudomonadota bacterium]